MHIETHEELGLFDITQKDGAIAGDWLRSRWYTFVTEDGEVKCTYDDYLKNKELRKKISDRRRAFVPLGRTIVSFDRKVLRADKVKKALFEEVDYLQKQNPLRYFVPSGPATVDFLNDWEHDLKGNLTGNRLGKSTTAWIDILLSIVPCDRDWEIFTEEGVKFREYEGKKVVSVNSYEFVNHETTLWPQVIRKWTPTVYLDGYQEGGKKRINWRGRPKLITKWYDLYFVASSQGQNAYESQAVDIWMWDEQGKEVHFDGADERTRTVDGRHVFSLTPHRLEDRPDTGAGTWIEKLFEGHTTKGHNIRFYNTPRFIDVPDWVYPEDQKIKAVTKWIHEPLDNKDERIYKEGLSRIFGKFHESGGMVYPEFDIRTHVIEPFEPPESWTRWRAIDHGTVNDTVCLFAAVNPDGDIFVYDEYDKAGARISENCTGIIEKAGNEREFIGTRNEEWTGLFYEMWREKPLRAKFYSTILDSRSWAQTSPSTGAKLSQEYMNFGIDTVQARGDKLEYGIPVVAEYLRLDSSRRHYESKELGAPRVYITANCKRLIYYLRHYVMQAEKSASQMNRSEKPVEKDDHYPDAFRYLLTYPAVYVPGWNMDDFLLDKEGGDVVYYKDKLKDKFTAY